MPEARERKKSDKIKGKDRKPSSPAKKDVRRRMTAKLQKELTERQRNRGTGGTDQPPEVQAAEQVEEKIYTTADSLRERTGDAISKSIARHRRKQQKKKQRAEPATGNTPPTDAGTAPTPVQQPIKERHAGDMRMRPAESDRPPDIIHEQSAAPHSGPERPPAATSPNERMRQTAIKEKQDRRTGPRQRPTDPKGQQLSAHGQATPASLDNQSINPIKERPRRSFAPKEKPAGGSFIPKTRQAAAASKSAAKSASTAAKGKKAARPLAQAKRRVQRNAQRKLLQQSKATAKTALELSRKATVVTAKAVSALISALAGLLGGAFLIPMICLVVLVGAIIASPFGILFSNEPTPGAMPLNVAVGQLNMELSNTLETLQAGDYSSIDVQGQGPDWREVVAVFAAKTAGADDGTDVAALTPDRVELLRAVFWDMCVISSEAESIDHPATDTTEAWTETILHITITAKTAEDMRTEYAFTEYQNQALTELASELATMDILLTDLSVSQEQARDLLRSLPADLSPERRAAVETACQLVGKVNYFWGGKSLVMGWDSRWGTLQKVWAEGSSTSGTYLPYGLDCSGFVDWVFYNVTGGSYIIGHGGGAHAQHTYCTAITWAEAQPGDLVFYPEDTHVGIVGGWDADGNILIIHCAYGYNNVVITKQEGFTTIGRPLYYSE